MKIIFASKFYYRRGGLEAYLFKAKELLEDHGNEMIPFSTDFRENYASEYSDLFCKYCNLSKAGFSKCIHGSGMDSLVGVLEVNNHINIR